MPQVVHRSRDRVPLRLSVVVLLAAACLAVSAAAQQVPDRGVFKLEFGGASGNEDYGYVREALHQNGHGKLHGVVGDLNAAINLAETVKITFIAGPPGMSSAKYNVVTNQVLITYEFVVKMHDLFGGDIDGWYPNVEQLVLHEMAHALITELIAASECGEATCFYAELSGVDFAATPRPSHKPAIQYGFVPTKARKEADNLVCNSPAAALVDSCKL